MQLTAGAGPCPLALQTFSQDEGYKGSLPGVAHERRMVPHLQPRAWSPGPGDAEQESGLS